MANRLVESWKKSVANTTQTAISASLFVQPRNSLKLKYVLEQEGELFSFGLYVRYENKVSSINIHNGGWI